jgi:cell division protein FtsI/penicillin-binding protein 2
MAALLSIVPNRGQLASPHLVGPDPPLKKVQGYNWERLALGLQGALTHGTASASGGSALGLAGKTGTVENEPSASNPKGYNHTWFVGYWQPNSKQEEPLVIAVFLERSGGYGGGLAAPIAVSMLKAQ